jgi:hypothetical protein
MDDFAAPIKEFGDDGDDDDGDDDDGDGDDDDDGDNDDEADDDDGRRPTQTNLPSSVRYRERCERVRW